MLHVRRFVSVILLVVSACKPDGVEPGAHDDPLAQFRRELADPKLYPVRHGDKIDEAAVQAAVRDAVAKHRDELVRRSDASLATLPEAAPPDERTYQQRAVLELNDGTEDTEAGEMMWALDAGNVERTAGRTLSSFLPVAMQQAGMTVSDLSPWLGFFFTARPTYTQCGRTASLVSICVDYGGLDVFVLDFLPLRGALVASRLRWMTQRG